MVFLSNSVVEKEDTVVALNSVRVDFIVLECRRMWMIKLLAPKRGIGYALFLACNTSACWPLHYKMHCSRELHWTSDDGETSYTVWVFLVPTENNDRWKGESVKSGKVNVCSNCERQCGKKKHTIIRLSKKLLHFYQWNLQSRYSRKREAQWWGNWALHHCGLGQATNRNNGQASFLSAKTSVQHGYITRKQMRKRS